MHLSLKQPQGRFRHLAILAVGALLSMVNAPALSTGVPLQFTIDPATVRQGEKDESPVVATVVLKAPSPAVFVCQIRSSDPNKLTFARIVFKIGDIKGQATGTIHWLRVLTDSAVKVSAFSVDAPGDKLWFTVALKPKDQDEIQPANGPAP
jgi:hypothetical protein